jgi:hypothetical protein
LNLGLRPSKHQFAIVRSLDDFVPQAVGCSFPLRLPKKALTAKLMLETEFFSEKSRFSQTG